MLAIIGGRGGKDVPNRALASTGSLELIGMIGLVSSIV